MLPLTMPSQGHTVKRRQRLPLLFLPVLGCVAFSITALGVWVIQRSLRSGSDVELRDASRAATLFPTSLKELSSSAEFISLAALRRPVSVLAALALTFAFKQTFCVPGSAVLNLFAGIAFGSFFGTAISAVMTAAGASLAYLLSAEFGAALLTRWSLEERVMPLRLRVGAAQKSGALFLYLIALRLATVMPQWLVNLASPHVAVPLNSFFVCTLIGALPHSFLTVSAGAELAALLRARAAAGEDAPDLAWSDIVSWKAAAMLMGLAALVAVPGLFLRRIEAWLAVHMPHHGHSHSHVRTPSHAAGAEDAGADATAAASSSAASTADGLSSSAPSILAEASGSGSSGANGSSSHSGALTGLPTATVTQRTR